MIIERTSNEVVFRLRKNTRLDYLQDLADWLEYTEIAQKSKATQEDVDNLVKEVKKERWKRTKQMLTK